MLASEWQVKKRVFASKYGTKERAYRPGCCWRSSREPPVSSSPNPRAPAPIQGELKIEWTDLGTRVLLGFTCRA